MKLEFEAYLELLQTGSLQKPIEFIPNSKNHPIKSIKDIDPSKLVGNMMKGLNKEEERTKYFKEHPDHTHEQF